MFVSAKARTVVEVGTAEFHGLEFAGVLVQQGKRHMATNAARRAEERDVVLTAKQHCRWI